MPAQRKVAQTDIVLAIDPSSTIAGLAVGWGKPLIREHLLASSIVPLDGELHDRAEALIAIVAKWHGTYRFNRMVIEMWEKRDDPTGAKAGSSGAIGKLSFMIAALWAWGKFAVPLPVQLVPVSVWKGQLPKEVMLRRLQKRGLCLGLRPTDRDMNESDAVGLLSWHLEKHV